MTSSQRVIDRHGDQHLAEAVLGQYVGRRLDVRLKSFHEEDQILAKDETSHCQCLDVYRQTLAAGRRRGFLLVLRWSDVILDHSGC
jgi:hypothetical protein